MVPKTGSPRGKVHKSDRWGTYSDKATVIVHVDPKDHMLASIEASASLKITGDLGLAYVKKGVWKLKPEAPYGVGCKGQPLVPKRDFAQGHTGSFTWPYGTRLDVIEKPDDLPMFTGEPHQDVGWLKADVRKPWTGPNEDADWWLKNDARTKRNFRKPTYGGQMCLNILGIKDDGDEISEDGAFGNQTRGGIETWFKDAKDIDGLFDTDNLPERMHSTDPAIYWALREHAHRVYTSIQEVK
jgi:hypothetical protein